MKTTERRRAKTLGFVLGATLLSLTACASSPVRDDSPANDLQAMLSSLRRDAAPRHYPSGKDYCVEEAFTGEQMTDCASSGEDLHYLDTEDKRRMLGTAERAVKRVELSRNPCTWYEKLFRVDRCRAE